MPSTIERQLEGFAHPLCQTDAKRLRVHDADHPWKRTRRERDTRRRTAASHVSAENG